jgi:hypothetical protein
LPEHPQPALDRGPLANFDHIVVLMMENRSFDHVLGYLSKEGDKDGKKRPDVDGLRGGEKNRYKGNDYFSFLLPDTKFDESPNHGHDGVVNQVNGGKMDGFVILGSGSHPGGTIEISLGLESNQRWRYCRHDKTEPARQAYEPSFVRQTGWSS